ncbi:MAG: chorismate synthase [Sandaracinaceae bacterium]|nr:chorismate synthase [Sandaracinaceae bacterium]
MPGSSIGQAFRVTTAGESHGPANVVIVDGCPAGLPLSVDDLLPDLARRATGQSSLVSQRKESDVPEIVSGVHEGITTGTSIAIVVRNDDARSKDYEAIAALYRPGHADYTYEAKHGVRDPRGGGRASARETVARVCAGAIAKKLLHTLHGTEVLAYVVQIGHVRAAIDAPERVHRAAIETLEDGTPNDVRCPDPAAAREMRALIEAIRKDRDSVGGVAEIVATHVPRGLGEPVFDKLKADLAKALFSLPAVMGVEVGSGFACAAMRGSEHNDLFEHTRHDDLSEHTRGAPPPALTTRTNRHGGMLGGISSGMPIVMRAAVKPTSSIPRSQPTFDREGHQASLTVIGRHDPCLLPRFAPMAEAMVAIVLADHSLRQRSARL